MALTDAISVACKALGFGADVYWAKDATKYTPRTAEQKPSKAEMESFNQAHKEQFDYTCQDCKQPITPQSFNGKLYRVSDISKGAMKKYGVPLCWACMEKRKANESPTA